MGICFTWYQDSFILSLHQFTVHEISSIKFHYTSTCVSHELELVKHSINPSTCIMLNIQNKRKMNMPSLVSEETAVTQVLLIHGNCRDYQKWNSKSCVFHTDIWHHNYCVFLGVDVNVSTSSFVRELSICLSNTSFPTDIFLWRF